VAPWAEVAVAHSAEATAEVSSVGELLLLLREGEVFPRVEVLQEQLLLVLVECQK
jgi:hypothetical protein